ncbi:MAG: SDR family NAD(P)-dependent oxidoreductase [Planctomycetota bacterium]
MTERGLKGRVALITGGGSGIGRATTLRLAEAGARVVVCGRRLEPLEQVAKECAGEAVAIACDVTSPESVDAAVAETVERFGSLTILVNGAGVAPSAKLEQTSEELWRSVFATNIDGVYRMTKTALPHMKAAGWGRIIQVASTAARTGFAYVSAYCASKHAVLGFTRAIALEVARENITVNAVCPGYVDSPMTDASVKRIAEKTGRPEDEVRGTLEATSPQRRLIQPEEVAATIAMLCSEEARGIHGQAIQIDGGAVVA